MKELIKLNEIECDEIKKNILQCENEILKFTGILRKHMKLTSVRMKAKNLNELLKIEKTDPAFRQESMYTRITKSAGYGYRVNTQVDITAYQVIWAFDLTGKKIESHTLYDFDKEWIENVLYFVFEQREYMDEHEAEKGRFFSIYVAGMEYQEDGTYEKHHQRLAHNNDNYELTSILNAKVATRAIKAINYAIDEYLLLEGVKSELSNETDSK
ncbi:hypothetical protein [Hungatella hathewayi]|uniref:hypothetical protein n=1 Tax=Hungatella hathewayi TaxID=154046 RepID=UPI00356305EF